MPHRIVAIIVAFMIVMLFFFVPETFWDRTPSPRPKGPSARPSFIRRISSRYGDHHHGTSARPSISRKLTVEGPTLEEDSPPAPPAGPAHDAEKREGEGMDEKKAGEGGESEPRHPRVEFALTDERADDKSSDGESPEQRQGSVANPGSAAQAASSGQEPAADAGIVSADEDPEKKAAETANKGQQESSHTSIETCALADPSPPNGRTLDPEMAIPEITPTSGGHAYTIALRRLPAQTFTQQLRPYHGRLSNDTWFKVMLRPFVLFTYPAVLWSAAVYACSVGWLIVISESMAMIYMDADSYNFNALQTGLVYLSPFIGGLLGTAVAGKVSDIIVKAMSRRNGGLYEPEFRLVMGAPILITTVIGLMGFGWSAEERDHFMVPTIFFGITSFGCSLGSTTSITFCVDSYRQYAGEALVTLNFSKNVLHGLVFSLFFTHWMADDGSKMVFIWTGVIQLILMLTTIPLYIYGKRWRMWTVRKNLVEKVNKS